MTVALYSSDTSLHDALTVSGYEICSVKADAQGGMLPLVAVILDIRSKEADVDAIVRWKMTDTNIQILVLSSPGGEHLRALEAGASDYLIAPFSTQDVVRLLPPPPQVISLEDGELDVLSRMVRRADQEHRLTAMEAKLVAFLSARPNTAFSREQLQVRIWGYRPGIRSRTVISTVSRLRNKIEVEPKSPRHLLTTASGAYWFQPAHSMADEASRPSHNLPAQRTRFVGRASDRERLKMLLCKSDIPLVTLVGMGGIGKTRLALAVADETLEHWRDGVVFVDLAASTDMASLLDALIAALCPGAPGDELTSLKATIASRSFLLVLDNFEQIVCCAAVLNALIDSAPQMTILVTSRIILRLQSEQVFRLGGLTIPPDGDHLEYYDASRLFLDVAARARADHHVVEPDERQAVARLCALLEGMPLALSLAASWVRLLTVEDIFSELQSSLDLLKSHHNDVSQRHQSTRASFENSWRLLPASMQQALAAISFFRNAFDRQTAQALAQVSLQGLITLSDASLIRRSTHGRYDLHPLIREYAREKLERDEEHHHRITATHRRLFTTRMTALSQELHRLTRPEVVLVALVEKDLRELEYLWGIASKTGDAETLWALWLPILRTREGRAGAGLTITTPAIQGLIEVHGPTPTGPLERAILAIMLAWSGLSRFGPAGRSELERAQQLCEQGTTNELRIAKALTLSYTSLSASLGGIRELARSAGKTAMALARAERSIWLEGVAGGQVSANAGVLGHPEDILLLQDVIERLPVRGGRMEGRSALAIGDGLVRSGRIAEAIPILQHAFQCLRTTNDQVFIIWAGHMLGTAYARYGDGRASALFCEVLEEAYAIEADDVFICWGFPGIIWMWSEQTAPELLRFAARLVGHIHANPAIPGLISNDAPALIERLRPLLPEAVLKNEMAIGASRTSRVLAGEVLEEL